MMCEGRRKRLLVAWWRGRQEKLSPAWQQWAGGQADRRRLAVEPGGWPGMLRRWAGRAAWPCNVVAYAALFAAGDAAQQELVRRRRGRRGSGGPDWRQTRHVALVALAFHGHFSYAWLRALERLLPGRAPRAVLAKVLCDQLLAAPLALLAFYTGMSILQGKEDIFLDCRQKFWNTYKTGLMYWPFVQLSNFSLVPVYLRTVYTGLCGFIWVAFLCFSQQCGDGTIKSAFRLFWEEKANMDDEKSLEK